MKTLRTPLEYFNIVSGGLRFSTLVELWGANRSGKSTFAYQVCGSFLEDYPKGKVLLLDTESSFDELRMTHAFKWDLKRVETCPISCIEEGFFSIIKAIEDVGKDPLVILWDTISAAPTRKALENVTEAKKSEDLNMHSAGIQERPKVIKHFLRDVMSMIYNKPVVLILPNQIFSGIGAYAPSEISGEGSALKHDLHYSFHFKLKASKQGKEKVALTGIEYDEATGLVERVISTVSLVKSKFSPGFQKKLLYIDGTKGGVIDVDQSFLLTAHELGYIEGERGWFTVGEDRFRWTDLVEQAKKLIPAIKKDMQKKLIKKFFLIRVLYEEMGMTDLVKEADKEANKEANKGTKVDKKKVK